MPVVTPNPKIISRLDPPPGVESADDLEAGGRLTIDELARESALTTRNIRAYQTRGLLPPPRLIGRTGYYDTRHLERLRLVQQMQAEGLNLNAIGWLLGGASGVDPAEILALKRTLLEPDSSDTPYESSVAELQEQYADIAGEPEAIARAVALGLVEVLPTGRVRVRQPTLLRRGQELAAMGIPVADQLDVFAAVMERARDVADDFIDLITRFVLDPWTARGRPAAEWPQVRERLVQLRPIGSEVLLAVFSRVLTEEIEKSLAEAPRIVG